MLFEIPMSKFALIFVALISLNASAAGLQCGALFGVTPPKVSNVAEALDKLSKEEAQYFFETDWGPATELVTPDDTFGYEGYMKNSGAKPQPFYNKINDRMGGIAVFKGHIYAEGYYRTNEEPIIEKLIVKQPWFEWNTSTNSYIVRHGKLGEKLFAPFAKNGEVTLYRGLSKAEVDLLQRLKDGDESVLKDLFSNRDGIFFTPDGSRMSTWATDGYFIEIKLKAQDFNQVYAGIEFDYVETALPMDVIKRVISSMVVHTVKTK